MTQDTADGPTRRVPTPAAAGSRWTARRVVAVVVGAVLVLVGLGMLAGGGLATWLDHQRDGDGYLTADTHAFTTASYALASGPIDLHRSAVRAVLGTVRVQVAAVEPATAVFVGVARRADAERYLAQVDHVVVTHWAYGPATYRHQAGDAPSEVPTAGSLWVASAWGVGPQAVTWRPTAGSWVVVVMNADAAAEVAVTASVTATVPGLGWISGGLFVVGNAALVAGVLLVAVPLIRVSRPRQPPAGTVDLD